MRWLVPIVLLVAPARAEGPITVTAGIGPSTERFTTDQVTYYDGDDGYRATTTIHLYLGYRVAPTVALGIHAGLSRAADLGTGDSSSGNLGMSYTPLHLGIGGMFGLGDRVWFTPWVGLLDVTTIHTALVPDRSFAFGLDLGVDVYEKAGHRIAVFAGFAHSGDWTYDPYNYPSNGYLALTLGAAYRYW